VNKTWSFVALILVAALAIPSFGQHKKQSYLGWHYDRSRDYSKYVYIGEAYHIGGSERFSRCLKNYMGWLIIEGSGGRGLVEARANPEMLDLAREVMIKNAKQYGYGVHFGPDPGLAATKKLTAQHP